MKDKHLLYQIILLISILSISMIIIIGCSVSNKITEANYHLIKTPPNGVKIADNFYCDLTEISNVDWLEYLAWTKRIFGENSVKYLAALPDSLVWMGNGTCLEGYVEFYFRQPTFNSFPVVGVTQQQSFEYSRWRSDRWFEKLLIDMHKIEWDSTQNKDTYFTIEKYFNGTFGYILPGEKVKFYPNFRLPTPEERKMILHFADSIDISYFETCNSKYCRECKTNFPKMHSDVIPCAKDTFLALPTMEIFYNCSSKKGIPIYNLRGNVCEWSSVQHISFGGGWKDRRDRILQADTFFNDSKNAWTGFRNVHEWKQWKE